MFVLSPISVKLQRKKCCRTILRICHPQNFVSKRFVLRGFHCTQTWSRLKQDPHHGCSPIKTREEKKKETKRRKKEGGGGGYAKKMLNILALLLQQWLCWEVLTPQADQQRSTRSGLRYLVRVFTETELAKSGGSQSHADWWTEVDQLNSYVSLILRSLHGAQEFQPSPPPPPPPTHTHTQRRYRNDQVK